MTPKKSAPEFPVEGASSKMGLPWTKNYLQNWNTNQKCQNNSKDIFHWPHSFSETIQETLNWTITFWQLFYSGLSGYPINTSDQIGCNVMWNQTVCTIIAYYHIHTVCKSISRVYTRGRFKNKKTGKCGNFVKTGMRGWTQSPLPFFDCFFTGGTAKKWQQTGKLSGK